MNYRGGSMLDNVVSFFDIIWRRHRYVTIIAVTLTLTLWNAPYLYTLGLIQQNPGDSDYFFQAYEAIRKTILEYHQFPWWNPWVGGGVALFANPQVGVFSLQTILVLLFGTVIGLKVSVLLYLGIGFWGMFALLHDKIRLRVFWSLLLAFCWIANGFFVAHLFQHYSFIYFVLAPLGIYLQLSIRRPWYWLWLGLFLGVLCLSALHYALLQICFIMGGVALYQISTLLFQADYRRLRRTLLLYGASALMMFILAGVRIFYTVQYVLQYPKSYQEDLNSMLLLIKGLTTPGASSNVVNGVLIGPGNQYGSHEYSMYVGVGILIAMIVVVAYTLYRKLVQLRERGVLTLTRQEALIGLSVSLAVFFFSMAIGKWDPLSPLSLLTQLPGYSDMRVSSRWLLWTAFWIIVTLALFLAKAKTGGVRSVVGVLVIVGSIELAFFGFWSSRHQFTREPVVFREQGATFVQYENFTPSVDEKQLLRFDDSRTRSLYNYEFEATRNNIGELYGYEPVFSTLHDTQGRCGSNRGCSLVQSHNAVVTEWSPNMIKLQRTGKGRIILNIAPSQYWVVNEYRLHGGNKVTGSGLLSIDDDDDILVLRVEPRSPFEVINSRFK